MKFMYGTPEMGVYVSGMSNTLVFNFNSLKEGFIELNLLPENNLGAVNEYDFDIKYMQYIFSDDDKFIQFVAPINRFFSGMDIFIVVDYYYRSMWEDNLIESLLKLIQTRYGIFPCKVETIDDYEGSGDTDINRGYGIVNYDQDMQRFMNICNGRAPYYESQIGGLVYGGSVD